MLLEEGSRKRDPSQDYGSKIELVFKDVKRILDSTADAKVLVFSAWSEALVLLSTLLKQHNISFSCGRAINGIKSSGTLSTRIDRFRTCPTVRVLLLNALKQSTGLTLTQANNIFLMDPIDAASELQAIGRSYRIGQLRPTNIFRYNIDPESLKDKEEE